MYAREIYYAVKFNRIAHHARVVIRTETRIAQNRFDDFFSRMPRVRIARLSDNTSVVVRDKTGKHDDSGSDRVFLVIAIDAARACKNACMIKVTERRETEHGCFDVVILKFWINTINTNQCLIKVKRRKGRVRQNELDGVSAIYRRKKRHDACQHAVVTKPCETWLSQDGSDDFGARYPTINMLHMSQNTGVIYKCKSGLLDECSCNSCSSLTSINPLCLSHG